MTKNSIMRLSVLTGLLLLTGIIATAATRIVVCEEAYKSR